MNCWLSRHGNYFLYKSVKQSSSLTCEKHPFIFVKWHRRVSSGSLTNISTFATSQQRFCFLQTRQTWWSDEPRHRPVLFTPHMLGCTQRALHDEFWHNTLLTKWDFCVQFWIFATGQTVTESDANYKRFRLISENLVSSYRCASILILMCESSKCWNVDWVSHKSRRNRVCTAEEALSVKRRTSYWQKKQKLMTLKVLRVSRQSCLFLFAQASGLSRSENQQYIRLTFPQIQSD